MRRRKLSSSSAPCPQNIFSCVHSRSLVNKLHHLDLFCLEIQQGHFPRVWVVPSFYLVVCPSLPATGRDYDYAVVLRCVCLVHISIDNNVWNHVYRQRIEFCFRYVC